MTTGLGSRSRFADKYAARNRSGGAYEAIREAIVSGQYAPGTQLVERLLAEELGISRTPVRDALARLVAEGFVEQMPNLGVFVRKLDRHEAIQLVELRQVLESGAAALAAGQISRDQGDELIGLAEELDRAQVEFHAAHAALPLDLDTQFHQRVCVLAQNDEISRILFTAGTVYLAFAPAARLSRPGRFSDHVAVARAIARGDRRAAQDAMWTHFDISLALLADHDEAL